MVGHLLPGRGGQARRLLPDRGAQAGRLLPDQGGQAGCLLPGRDGQACRLLPDCHLCASVCGSPQVDPASFSSCVLMYAASVAYW